MSVRGQERGKGDASTPKTRMRNGMDGEEEGRKKYHPLGTALDYQSDEMAMSGCEG